jgi:uncharacterized damage-inducible protein DinB
MLFNSLEEIFTHMNNVRAEVTGRIGTLDEAEAVLRNNGEGWCPEELAEHLALVEKSITAVVERLLRKSEELNMPPPPGGKIEPPVKFPSAVRKTEMNKVEAPDRIRPRGGVPTGRSLQDLKTSREYIKDMRPRMEAVSLSEAKFPHPVMGELDLYQWLLFIAEHEARHLAQIENILKQNDTTAESQAVLLPLQG